MSQTINSIFKMSMFLLLVGTLFPATSIRDNLQSLNPLPITIQNKIEILGLRIDSSFPGGNVIIEKVSNDTVYFKPDLRDTEGHWFYWNFRVTANKAQTWYFKSTEPNVLTGMGAAYSKNGGHNWNWIDQSWNHGEEIFQFTFGRDDETVRLSMGMAYTQDNFDRFITPFSSDARLKLETLCTTKNGREVEKLVISDFHQTPSIKILFTARAQWWDYGWAAANFVTIFTKDRRHYFGEVNDGKMNLTPVGAIADVLWYEIKNHANHVELDEFVVMPNHIHGILVLKNDSPVVGTGDALSLQPGVQTGIQQPGQKRFQNPGINTLSSIVGSYKSAVTRHLRRLGFKFEWQSRFHDHIIRDDLSYQRIAWYIKTNPENWKDDKFNSEL